MGAIGVGCFISWEWRGLCVELGELRSDGVQGNLGSGKVEALLAKIFPPRGLTGKERRCFLPRVRRLQGLRLAGSFNEITV
jgi:hypothetical protein